MPNSQQRISVIGLGYIGLPTAALVASKGIPVVGVDISERAVNTINQGQIHIVEPDLDEVVRAVVEEGMLRAVLAPEPADVFLIAVPTPVNADHSADLSFIKSAAKSLAPVLANGNLVILESTSPVGTTEKLIQWVQELRPDLNLDQSAAHGMDINFAYCPERVLPGQILRELVENDRVIGGHTLVCANRAQQFYSQFVKGELRITNSRTAEMVKLAENSFRDVNIAFANELSLVSDKLGINVWELIELANLHPRVNILRPGVGVGGHCIAVDPWFIVHSCPEEAQIIKMARMVNLRKTDYVVDQVLQKISSLDKPKVALLGLAFKPNVDDLRESPALEIAHKVAESYKGSVLVVEPHIHELPKELASMDHIRLSSLKEAAEEADVVVTLVDHSQFKDLRLNPKNNKVPLNFVANQAPHV